MKESELDCKQDAGQCCSAALCCARLDSACASLAAVSPMPSCRRAPPSFSCSFPEATSACARDTPLVLRTLPCPVSLEVRRAPVPVAMHTWIYAALLAAS